MMTFIACVAIGFVAFVCVKAVLAVKLLERDPQAFEQLQANEDRKRRQRQETVGKAALTGVRFVGRLLRKDGGQ